MLHGSNRRSTPAWCETCGDRRQALSPRRLVERKDPLTPALLAAYPDGSGLPIDMLPLQMSDLFAAKAESQQQQQQCPISTCDPLVTLRFSEERTDLLPRDLAWKVRVTARRRSGKRFILSPRNHVLLCEISKKRADARQRSSLRAMVGKALELRSQETDDVRETNCVPQHWLFNKAKNAELAQETSVHLAC
jgi:hypothetical protein